LGGFCCKGAAGALAPSLALLGSTRPLRMGAQDSRIIVETMRDGPSRIAPCNCEQSGRVNR